jgi:hypothetical protein
MTQHQICHARSQMYSKGIETKKYFFKIQFNRWQVGQLVIILSVSYRKKFGETVAAISKAVQSANS